MAVLDGSTFVSPAVRRRREERSTMVNPTFNAEEAFTRTLGNLRRLLQEDALAAQRASISRNIRDGMPVSDRRTAQSENHALARKTRGQIDGREPGPVRMADGLIVPPAQTSAPAVPYDPFAATAVKEVGERAEPAWEDTEDNASVNAPDPDPDDGDDAVF
jgi:hypothetical protein